MKIFETLVALLIALIALLFAARVQATEFNQLQPDKSRVSFVFTQMNVPVEGEFKRVKGTVSFDPQKPTIAKANISIDLNSIDAGSDEANDAIVGKPWFDVAVFPVASFVTSEVKTLGSNRFEVTGNISIKGHTMQVKAPAIFHQEGPLGVFEGNFILKRADYKIGEGSWAAFDTVANEVQVKFKLVAMAATSKK
jgi:polyisoprenoid-binding protein YceI